MSFSPYEAEALLRERYGAPSNNDAAIIEFVLPDRRSIAIDLDAPSPQLWVEAANLSPPPVESFRSYSASQERPRNLPDRLTNSGQSARPVLMIRLKERHEMEAMLSWYNSAESDVIDRFRISPYFTKAIADWTNDQRDAFRRIALAVHESGMDWWAVNNSETPIRFGRKTRDTARAKVVQGFHNPKSGVISFNSPSVALDLGLHEFTIDPESAERFVRILRERATEISTWRPFSDARQGLWPDEGISEVEMNLDPTPIWIVTARWGTEDGVQRFVDRGEWSLLSDTGSANNDRMRQMQPGDRIVMRDYFHQSRDLPFEANGTRISAIRIRAVGTVTEQRGDGLSVGVAWDTPLPEPRVWYFYTQNDPVWWLKEPGESPYADRLRAFILHDAEQDYAYFLEQWFGTEDTENKNPMPSPTNLILYGPPGTGKTYATAREAVRLCGETVPENREALMALYRSLQHKGRIGFVTFHQNFAYEDFVEGLRPATGDGAENSAGFSLNPEPGVFRRIAEMAAKPVPTSTTFSFAGRRVFKLSLGESGKTAWNWVYEQSIEDGYALFGFRDVDWSDEKFSSRDAILAKLQDKFPDEKVTSQTGIVKSPDRFRNQIGIGDVVIISKGLNAFRAIGVVEGEYEYAPREGGSYCHRRKVRWLWEEPEGIPVGEISATRFSLDTVYELPKERLNLDVLTRYVAGADEEAQDSGDLLPHVLIIDEINRANISKVFGELITLLEPDKRLGMPNALTVRLPYSKAEFGVPANLHVIGTMNTADRSIALLDTALRRRFTFREMAPDPTLLGTVDGIPLPRVLTTINERIEYLVDREHRIGHAFFIHCKTRDDVNAVMRDKIIPLLQEYFFEDWSRIAAVVGPGFIKKGELKAPPGLGDLQPRPTWSVLAEFPHNAYDALLSGAAVSTTEGEDAPE